MNVKIFQADSYDRNIIGNDKKISQDVSNILNDIEQRGDQAVDDWSIKFDEFKPLKIKLKPFVEYGLNKEIENAILIAHQRIRSFCSFQMKDLKNDQFQDEIGTYGYKYQPIERIGAYIPGGRFPLISTALMTLTPAKVAGCPYRLACSPSDDPALLAAASLAGATDFIRIGGAQAIGALSNGYNNSKPVNMIVGPGNAYVNSAKAQVQHRTKIDTLAGPSELLVYANQLDNPQWIINDALAQAEHDPNAVSLILSCNFKLLQELLSICQNSLDAKKLLDNNQIQFVIAQSLLEAQNFINNYAPEHLMICDSDIQLKQLKNYGALFIGESSAVAYGDYCSGPNHTLPTSATAKFSGGLSVHSFMKVLTYQKINNDQRSVLSKISAVLAEAEGLSNHKASVECRF
jgi:histidinol dehydrogenase